MLVTLTQFSCNLIIVAVVLYAVVNDDKSLYNAPLSVLCVNTSKQTEQQFEKAMIY